MCVRQQRRIHKVEGLNGFLHQKHPQSRSKETNLEPNQPQPAATLARFENYINSATKELTIHNFGQGDMGMADKNRNSSGSKIMLRYFQYDLKQLTFLGTIISSHSYFDDQLRISINFARYPLVIKHGIRKFPCIEDFHIENNTLNLMRISLPGLGTGG